MKLDKIKFAQVVAYIGELKPELSVDVHALDSMIDIDVTPVEVPGKADPADLDKLMGLMASGGQVGTKIEAIKLYRQITGCMLKESKDAVEKHWTNKPNEPATLGDILNKATERGPVNFDKFEG